ncbi:hypothetical protein Rcae01_06791 [Novipirellula caenicola]|uniref:Uncharacterized protein n=1 Tax=Novipirellula caenicola TaxID=1536901 RepID=A0ABP9W1L3_9BACT
MIAIEAIERAGKRKCNRRSRPPAMVERSKNGPSYQSIGGILVRHDTRIVIFALGRIGGRIKNDLSVSERERCAGGEG